MASSKSSLKISTQELAEVYKWVKKFRLSKDIKNISRDMMDGVLVAEILKQRYPKLVELHNYTKCHSRRNKLSNWQTLNRKVLSRLNIYLDDAMLLDLAGGNTDILEVVLYELMVQEQNEEYERRHHAVPEADRPWRDMDELSSVDQRSGE